ncbi:FAD-dependent pyridine nucleotide-disulfide oxidoreductase [Rhodospirillaceae bacterium LM-1]|nr:FAD-dependent pyridine nucleotide-disulfide oxidoreductase [Rhodospirillaceae bacterium LM-1]
MKNFDPSNPASPCQAACPVGTDVPAYLDAIWRGDFKRAFEVITHSNPFASICGRVCDAPCEPACRREESDGAIAIRALKRFVMDKGESLVRPPVHPTRLQSVGIVGAGPSGLTAAQDLALAGFKVTIYEASPRLGGMMVWGIPRFRLPDGVIDEDIQRLLARCPGIVVATNTALGRDISLSALKEKHDAVLLAIGATKGKRLDLVSDVADRLIDGVAFLKRVNAGERPAMPAHVLVVGGGDVAMDAARAACRLPGVETVKIVYRRGRMEMPARKHEIEGAEAEGIEIIFNTVPIALKEDVLTCQLTRLGEAGADGRHRFEIVTASDHDIPCGLVIAAIGQEAACDELSGLGLLKNGWIAADPASLATSDPKVFACGDGAFGGSSIVNAMRQGHMAAYLLTAHLEGRANPPPFRTAHPMARPMLANDPEWERLGREMPRFVGLAKGLDGEVEEGFSDDVARAQAARCLRCDAETPSKTYDFLAREHIVAMGRVAPDDVATQWAILSQRLKTRVNPFPAGGPASLDDLVFLPANLSRLVIDPYREACRTQTKIASLTLNAPLIAAGFDQAPQDVRRDLADGLRASGSAYLGLSPLGGDVPWLQLLPPGAQPSSESAGVVLTTPGPLPKTHGVKGVVLTESTLEAGLVQALDQGFDLAVLDGSDGLGGDLAEFGQGPRLGLLGKAIRLLRSLNREEDISIIWFGYVRSGADVAKLLAMGANAVILGASLAIALGAKCGPEGLLGFEPPARTSAGRAQAVSHFLAALSSEAAMMARCTGKTSVHNLEPEDLRSITCRTRQITQMPMTGGRAGL